MSDNFERSQRQQAGVGNTVFYGSINFLYFPISGNFPHKFLENNLLFPGKVGLGNAKVVQITYN